MLTFLSPLFLAGAAAAVVPLVLHLLKREPEPRVKFAAVTLLKKAPVEATERHRLRELLLLALRVATLVLLALAFARPFFASGQALGQAGVIVVALDTSYSMTAPGRFERAQQLAKDAVARAPAGDLVAVITFADDAETAARLSADRVLATSAIDQARPGFGSTRYRSALSAAAQVLSGPSGSSAGPKTVVVVTDLQESGWDQGDRVSVPEGARIEIADVGPLPPNLAVTAVQPMADRVVATIHNAGPRARDVRAHLAIDGRPAGDVTATPGPGESVDITFAGAPRGKTAAVSVDDPDGLTADNVRYAVLTGASGLSGLSGSLRPSVLIVGSTGELARDAFYVQHALDGHAGRRGYDVSAIGGEQLSAEQGGASPAAVADDRLSSHAAVLLLSTRGLARRGREILAAYVQNGGGLLVAAGPDVDGDVAADVLGGDSRLKIASVANSKPAVRTLAPADVRHPIFRPFGGAAATLGLVRFQNLARVDAAGCQTLARFTTGEGALLECSPGEGRALIFASDLDNRWNDFPLHASFVPFVHEVVRYLSAARARASEYLIGDAPAGVPREPGVHVVRDRLGRGGPERRVAVNVDPREADPARLTAEEFQGAVARLKQGDAAARDRGGWGRGAGRSTEARQQEDYQHLWQYALALMLVTVCVEGVVASRTA